MMIPSRSAATYGVCAAVVASFGVRDQPGGAKRTGAAESVAGENARPLHDASPGLILHARSVSAVAVGSAFASRLGLPETAPDRAREP
jgi:hypothetical protein